MSLMGVVSDVTGKKSDSNSASKKKVQTPDKRMKQLNSFSTEWLKQHILTPASGDSDKLIKRRENAFARFKTNIATKTEKMLEIYNRENEDGEKRCGYFDPLTTHGGPQLNQPDLANKKQEKRREYLQDKNSEDKRGARHLLEQKYHIDSESMKRPVIHERRILAKLEDLSHIHSQLKQIELWFTQNFDDVDLPKFIVNMNQYDSLLGTTSQIEDYDRHRRTATDGKKKKKQEQYDDSDPRKAWKRITVGYRKWAQRYIAYCGQEYINKKFSRWAQEKLFFKGRNVYKSLNGIVDKDD